mgnify:CR=1 FL=1
MVFLISSSPFGIQHAYQKTPVATYSIHIRHVDHGHHLHYFPDTFVTSCVFDLWAPEAWEFLHLITPGSQNASLLRMILRKMLYNGEFPVSCINVIYKLYICEYTYINTCMLPHMMKINFKIEIRDLAQTGFPSSRSKYVRELWLFKNVFCTSWSGASLKYLILN